MKSVYSKFVAYLEKQEAVFFQRAGKSVYLSDGKIVLKVPATVYNIAIRPLSGIFVDAMEECIAEKRSYDVRLEAGRGMELKKHIDLLCSDALLDAHKSTFLTEIPAVGKKKKSTFARIYTCDKTVIAINEKFVDIFSDLQITGTWKTAGKWNQPLLQWNEDFLICMFPMRLAEGVIDIWKNIE